MKHGEVNGINGWRKLEQKGKSGEARGELSPEKGEGSFQIVQKNRGEHLVVHAVKGT